MVAFPEATPVTVTDVPVVPLIEAMPEFEVAHAFEAADETEPVNAKVFPTSTDDPPETVGRAFTVPLTATVLVVALVDVIDTLPDGVPVAVVAKRA
jgi:hypothetical protein